MKSLLLLSGLAIAGLGFALPGGDSSSSCSSSQAATRAGDTIVETAMKADGFGTLTAALKAADLVETLQSPGPFTVFAPTDDAFAQLPEGTLESLLQPDNRGLLTSILTYHVVSGDVKAADVVKLDFAATVNGQRVDIVFDEESKTVTIDGAKVVTTDIACSNGTIHVIDAVIMPSTNDLVETAVAAGQFETLAAAVRAAGLAEALTADAPLTVFAPTDEAFAQLPEGTVESLLKPENLGQLQAVLKHHVVAGRVYSDQALAAGEAKTLNGGTLRIEVREDVAFVGDAQILATDVEASNGVIHVIDRVLLPRD